MRLIRIPTIVYGPAFSSACLCCVTTYQPGGTVEEESWASPAVPIPPDGVKMVSRWWKRLRRERRTRERRSGDVGICGLGVAAAVGGSSLTRKWFPTSGWRFKDASTWTTAVERGWRQKQAWSPFLKYHRTGALFRLCEYDGLVH